MPALLEVDLWDRRKLFIINCDLGTEVAQLVKNPPAVWVTWVRSLGWEDLLEKGMATVLYSCLENSMDCIIHGIAKSQTLLIDFHFSYCSRNLFYLIHL